jgi:hypothetical protein
LIDKTSSIYLYVKLKALASWIFLSFTNGVYISQLIRYARASSNYSDFLKRHLYLRNRLLDKGYKKICLIRSLKKVYIPIPRSCRNIIVVKAVPNPVKQMSKTILSHTLIKKNIFDISFDFLIFIHFHYMKWEISHNASPV